jgi:hypothetical protein
LRNVGSSVSGFSPPGSFFLNGREIGRVGMAEALGNLLEHDESSLEDPGDVVSLDRTF